jgi:hypothetical protein
LIVNLMHGKEKIEIGLETWPVTFGYVPISILFGVSIQTLRSATVV